jgi:tetratricopeptide (TPR) repeat protein
MHLVSFPYLFVALSIALGHTPAATAQLVAEQCAEGTGVPNEDVLACTRAMFFVGSSPLKTATLLSARGRALQVLGKPRQALRDHEAALAANPLSAEAHLGRALARTDLDDRAGAERDLHKALALFPHFEAAWSALGRLRFLNRDNAGAIQALNHAIELGGHKGEVFVFRGLTSFRQRNFTAALADFSHAGSLLLGYRNLALWQWLAARHAGVPAAGSAQLTLQDLDADEWPAALLAVYLGQREPDTLLIDQDTNIKGPQRQLNGEMMFYLAQYDLLQGNTVSAAARFQRAAKLTGNSSVERAMLP